MATSLIPSVPFSQEEDNYTRMQMIIQKVCRKILIKYLEKKVGYIAPGDSIDQFLANQKVKITKGNEGRRYTPRFFPLDSNGHPIPANPQNWDIQMLSFILKGFCKPSPADSADIDFMREKRNYLSHLGNPEVADNIFTTFESDLHGIIKRLCGYLQDTQLEEEIKADLKAVHNRLSENLVDAYKALHRENHIEHDVRTLRKEHSEHIGLTKDNGHILKTVLKEVREIYSRFPNEAKQRFIPPECSAGKLLVKNCKSEEEEAQLTGAVVQNFSKYASREKVESTLQSCAKDMETYGQVTSVKVGCVEFSIQFHTLPTCLSYIDDVEEGKLDTIFEPLQAVFRQEFNNDKIELSFIMTCDQLQECITKICNGLRLQNASSDTFAKESHTRKNEHIRDKKSPDETKRSETKPTDYERYQKQSGDPFPPPVLTERTSPTREISVMASNENPTDSSAIKELGTKLKLFEQTSKGEPTQTRNADTPHMKRSGPFQNQVTTERESPSPRTYLSTHDSSVFKKPQCLISAIEANTLKVCDDVLDQISRIDKPCVIVSIAGLYRTGKSYLMNRLAGAHEGFALGDTIESMTKGIWVWCRVHPEQKDTVLILLETEGLGDIEKGDSNHDNRIFTLATLLCSTLVYNMKGAFDQDAVNKLTFVSEMSKSIRFGRRCDENNLLLQSILPGFVLALRDFSLKFIKGKRQLTPDEYLEEGLENKPEKRAYFNKPRECIRKFFPQEKRKCFAFPVPGDADTLENLDSLKFQDLSHRFQTVATQFVSYIYRQEPKQLQVSELVNGPMFATLTRRYVDAFAKGIVPDVDDAFSTVATIENRRVKDECMIMFRSRTNDMKLPLPSKSLDKHFKEARWSALEYMRTNAVQDVANIVEREAQMEMDLLWQQFQSQNKEEKEKHCTKVLSGLPSFSNLQARLQKTDYEVLGGHRKFKRDVDMVKQKYEQALREYEQPREIGLVWNNFVSDLCADENKILEKDNELSEDEKAREKEENAKSMERMKVEMAEANQKALAKQRNELDEQQKKLDAERERRDTEHQNKIADLQNKLAATLDENKEAQRRMLKQIRALHEEAEKRREEMNNKFEAMQKRRGGNILDVFFNTVKDIFDP